MDIISVEENLQWVVTVMQKSLPKQAQPHPCLHLRQLLMGTHYLKVQSVLLRMKEREAIQFPLTQNTLTKLQQSI